MRMGIIIIESKKILLENNPPILERLDKFIYNWVGKDETIVH